MGHEFRLKAGNAELISMHKLIESRHANKYGSTHLPATTLTTPRHPSICMEKQFVVSPYDRVFIQQQKGMGRPQKQE